MGYKILILNFGSTSTKIAIYDDLQERNNISINHPTEELRKFNSIWEQEEYRRQKIEETLAKHDYKLNTFSAISCRGGNIKPVQGGVYVLNDEMIADMRSGKYGVHPTNVGNAIAYKIGKDNGIPVIIADPPVTDEFTDLARFSGIKEITRLSSFHALNQKRTARKLSEDLGVSYQEINLIVVHLGGGISVGAHKKGKVIDVNNALDGDGPFSPERAGSLPVGDLIKMCYSGKYTLDEMLKKICGGGGLMSYLGTSDGREVENRIDNGDEYALKVVEAMAYQVSKEIGAMATVLEGNITAIVLTGGFARFDKLVDLIKKHTSFLAKVYLYPGENEIISLAENAYRYLTGKVKANKY